MYIFNVLMHRLCEEGKVNNTQAVFYKIKKRRLLATFVSFNTFINVYCQTNNLEDGFRLKNVMMASGMQPDVYTYGVLINALSE